MTADGDLQCRLYIKHMAVCLLLLANLNLQAPGSNARDPPSCRSREYVRYWHHGHPRLASRKRVAQPRPSSHHHPSPSSRSLNQPIKSQNVIKINPKYTLNNILRFSPVKFRQVEPENRRIRPLRCAGQWRKKTRYGRAFSCPHATSSLKEQIYSLPRQQRQTTLRIHG